MSIDVKQGINGAKIANGSDVFNKIYNTAIKDGSVNGVRAIWQSGDNLSTFNNLILNKVNKGLMTLEEAALNTFTGKMAKSKEFNKVKVFGTKNADGTYKYATVNFTK